MKTLEEIAYDAGRHALADQESLVNGIRQRTGTLLAAHALVASFLGAAAIRVDGLHGLSWVALASLVAGLVVAATLLGPWKLTFAMDARNLYAQLFEDEAGEVRPARSRQPGSDTRSCATRTPLACRPCRRSRWPSASSW